MSVALPSSQQPSVPWGQHRPWLETTELQPSGLHEQLLPSSSWSSHNCWTHPWLFALPPTPAQATISLPWVMPLASDYLSASLFPFCNVLSAEPQEGCFQSTVQSVSLFSSKTLPWLPSSLRLKTEPTWQPTRSCGICSLPCPHPWYLSLLLWEES